MSAVHQKKNNTTTTNQPGDYDSPDDLYQDPEDIDFQKPTSNFAGVGNSPMNNHKNNTTDDTDDDDIYDDPEVAEQLYQDPENISFHSKPAHCLVGGGGKSYDADDDIDEGAYHDPDTEGGFHVIPPVTAKSKDNDDAGDLYQDPEEIDFRHPTVASHRNDNYRNDYDSPNDDDYCEPPPDARVPIIPAHHRPIDKGMY